MVTLQAACTIVQRLPMHAAWHVLDSASHRKMSIIRTYDSPPPPHRGGGGGGLLLLLLLRAQQLMPQMYCSL
jgi:hypothetical protein